jgi:HK97 family phage prohead protease
MDDPNVTETAPELDAEALLKAAAGDALAAREHAEFERVGDALSDPEADEEALEELDDEAPAMEVRTFRGGIREVKEANRNGIAVGIVTGYLSTWEPDTGGRFGVPDKFERGAWSKSLQEHRNRGNRQVRLKDMHGRTIGGFPIDSVREDEVGLYGAGEINLETQLGREAYSLAKQKVLTDFSVGYIATSDKLEAALRRIFEAILLEGSIVDEPANQGARILEVKRAALYRAADVKAMTTRGIERALHESGAFSLRAARILVARLTPAPARYDDDEKKAAAILRDLKGARDDLAGRS